MSSATHPFEIEFLNPREIRMGSPYNYCEIRFTESPPIVLENAMWQDKCAWNPDGRWMVLIKYNLETNEPGFHFVIFNTFTGNSYQSEKILGLLNHFTLNNEQISYNSFLYSGKTATGELLGYNDFVYEFPQLPY